MMPLIHALVPAVPSLETLVVAAAAPSKSTELAAMAALCMMIVVLTIGEGETASPFAHLACSHTGKKRCCLVPSGACALLTAFLHCVNCTKLIAIDRITPAAAPGTHFP
jgi:hypothetical protein